MAYTREEFTRHVVIDDLTHYGKILSNKKQMSIDDIKILQLIFKWISGMTTCDDIYVEKNWSEIGQLIQSYAANMQSPYTKVPTNPIFIPTKTFGHGQDY